MQKTNNLSNTNNTKSKHSYQINCGKLKLRIENQVLRGKHGGNTNHKMLHNAKKPWSSSRNCKNRRPLSEVHNKLSIIIILFTCSLLPEKWGFCILCILTWSLFRWRLLGKEHQTLSSEKINIFDINLVIILTLIIPRNYDANRNNMQINPLFHSPLRLQVAHCLKYFEIISNIFKICRKMRTYIYKFALKIVFVSTTVICLHRNETNWTSF